MKILFILLCFNLKADEQLLLNYFNQVKQINNSFKEFDVVAGEKIFKTERINSKGELISCMTCHTSNPKNEGKTRANKIIEPLAPAVTKDRFTDMLKVEKWFKRNCKDVYDRECSAIEKGNFVKYMMSVK